MPRWLSQQSWNYLRLRPRNVREVAQVKTRASNQRQKSATVNELIKLSSKTKYWVLRTLTCSMKFTTLKTTTNLNNFTPGCRSKPKIWRVLILHRAVGVWVPAAVSVVIIVPKTITISWVRVHFPLSWREQLALISRQAPTSLSLQYLNFRQVPQNIRVLLNLQAFLNN